MTEDEMIALINPRTRQSKELFDKHFSELPDELSLIVLKGHLLVERSLTAIISHYYAQPSADIAKVGLRFVQKVALAKALVPSFFFPHEFWNFVHLLNQLRNDLAHQLEPKKLEEHLESLRTMFEAHRKFFEAKSYPTDEWKLKTLISQWLGVLNAIDALIHAREKSKDYTADLRRLVELLRELWQKWPDAGNAAPTAQL
jgi:hypothetical protein